MELAWAIQGGVKNRIFSSCTNFPKWTRLQPDYTNLKTCIVFFFFWISLYPNSYVIHGEYTSKKQHCSGSAVVCSAIFEITREIGIDLRPVFHDRLSPVTGMGYWVRFQGASKTTIWLERFMRKGNATLSTQTTKDEMSLLWPDDVLIALKRARLLLFLFFFFMTAESSEWSLLSSKIK